MKTWIRRWLLKNVLASVVVEDIITKKLNGVLVLDGNELSSGQLKELQEEAKFIRNSRLFRVLNNTLTHQAHEAMFNKSKDYTDMISGKMMLYNLSVINKIINKIVIHR